MNFAFVEWLAIGLLAGLLARWITPDAIRRGWIPALGLGVAGGLAGGVAAMFIPGLGSGAGLSNLLLACVGSVSLLWLWGRLGGAGNMPGKEEK